MSVARTSRSWSRTRSHDGGSRRNSYEPRQSGEHIYNTRLDRIDDFQRFILTDPIAARYLESDSCVTILEHRREITGHQAYIVEQWATSRTQPTFTITVHSGDASDRIVACVLGIPKDEAVWSQRLRIYFKALNHSHARRRDTPDGAIMVTNLAGFPSALTVIQVPGGDVSQHYADFFINEDLKRLGCSGRVGLTLTRPNNSTIAKYHQLYRTDDKNPLYSSVIELVRMCQIALHLFAVLDLDYVDGLLCDVTEHAVSKWWSMFGNDVYNVEPHDGVLGPTTVAALLGLLLGARNRLQSLGVPVPKDPFDIAGMKRGIWSFQKSQRLHRNRRLDELTLRKLHALTEKTAHGEGVWRVPKAVKTTVAELSGRGEELLAEGTNRKGKSGIAEMETTDIDVFEQLAYGERCKWLWHGKALKRTSTSKHGEATLDGILSPKMPTPDRKPRVSDGIGQSRTSLDDPFYSSGARSPRRSLEELPHRGTFYNAGAGAVRKVHGVLDDGKAGIDRLIGVVHPSKRAEPLTLERPAALQRPGLARSHTSPASPKKAISSPLRAMFDASSTEASPVDRRERFGSRPSTARSQTSRPKSASMDLQEVLAAHPRQMSKVPDVDHEQAVKKVSKSHYHGISLDEVLPVAKSIEEDVPPTLRRTQSLDATHDTLQLRGRKMQQRLSFSLAASSMTMSEGMFTSDDRVPFNDEDIELIRQRFYGEHMKRIRQAIKELSVNEGAWTISRLEQVELLVEQAGSDHDALQSLLDSPSRVRQDLHEMATMVLQEEQEMLDEGKRELETLAAKLDYEINILQGKIEDVEHGVEEYERAVTVVESRVTDAEKELHRAGWGCVML